MQGGVARPIAGSHAPWQRGSGGGACHARRRTPRRRRASSSASWRSPSPPWSACWPRSPRSWCSRRAPSSSAASPRPRRGAAPARRRRRRERQREALLRASLISSSPSAQDRPRVLPGTARLRRRRRRPQAAGHPAARGTIASPALLRSDGLAVVGRDGRVVVSAGPSAPGWPAGTELLRIADVDDRVGPGRFASPARPTAPPSRRSPPPTACASPTSSRRGASTPRYAAELAGEARSEIAVLVDDRLVASTSTGPALATLAAHLRRRDLPADGGAFDAAGEHHAYLLVQRIGPAAIYAVASITAARDRATADAVPRLIAIVAGGLVLCLVASISLARRVAAPIDRVSRDIHAMVESQEPAPAAPPNQSIKELDALGESFSTLLQTVHEARAETSAAYLGAIRALVAALDARDPYTAGHSERVSLLSVAIGARDGPRPGRPRRAAPRRAAARHRQDRHQRRHPDQADRAHRRRVRGDQAAHAARRADPAADRLPRGARADRRAAPRAARRRAAIRTACAATTSRSTPASSTSPTPSTR